MTKHWTLGLGLMSLCHVCNCSLGMLALAVGYGADRLGILRSLYLMSVAFAAVVIVRHRDNALFAARTFLLVLPGYYAAGVQLIDPLLYFSFYERAPQTLDISVVMWALTNIALFGSELGLWMGRRGIEPRREANPLNDVFFFYVSILPLFVTACYVKMLYGQSLFQAGYTMGRGVDNPVLGNLNAIAGILVLSIFAHVRRSPTPVKWAIFLALAVFYMVDAMLLRGGRQDVLSCLFGCYVVAAAAQEAPARVTARGLALGALLTLLMAFVGYIRGNALASDFDYGQSFKEMLVSYSDYSDTVHVDTVSPIANTFANTIYALKTGMTDYIYGRGYFDYIMRTPPAIVWENRPRDYAWIFQDWGMISGGGFFELAEAYLNLGVVGIFLAPFAVSWFFSRVLYSAILRRSLLAYFCLFGLLAIFLRGAFYQIFAYYKAVVTALIILTAMTFFRKAGTFVTQRKSAWGAPAGN